MRPSPGPSVASGCAARVMLAVGISDPQRLRPGERERASRSTGALSARLDPGLGAPDRDRARDAAPPGATGRASSSIRTAWTGASVSAVEVPARARRRAAARDRSSPEARRGREIRRRRHLRWMRNARARAAEAKAQAAGRRGHGRARREQERQARSWPGALAHHRRDVLRISPRRHADRAPRAARPRWRWDVARQPAQRPVGEDTRTPAPPCALEGDSQHVERHARGPARAGARARPSAWRSARRRR